MNKIVPFTIILILFSLCISRDIAKLEYSKISNNASKLYLNQNLNPVKEINGKTKLVQFAIA